jgi:hypothetical protein
MLATLRRHGVTEFQAGKLEGIGEGLRFAFGDVPAEAPPARNARPELSSRPADPDLRPEARPGAIDELALVAEGRDGPVPEDRIS